MAFMDEELASLQAQLVQISDRLNRCRKSSIPLKQAHDAVNLAISRIRMERRDRAEEAKRGSSVG